MSDVKQITGPDWDLANEDAAQWARTHVGELVTKIDETTRATIRREVAEFTRNKESITDLARRLENVPAFGEERARMIAVTEVTRAYAEGNQAAWRESGVVEGKEWLTSVDERVCPICGPMHGMIVPLNSEFSGPGGSFYGPPAHPRCRCDTAPVVILADAELGGFVYDPETGEFVPREEAPAPLIEPTVPAVDVDRGRFREFDASNMPGEQDVESWEMDSSYFAWEKGLTPQQREALEFYKQDGFTAINSAARGIDLPMEWREINEFMGLTQEEILGQMDSALRQHRLPNDITLWRGGKQRQLTAALDQGRDFSDLKGMIISDDAYLSASINKDSASEFVKWGGKDAFEIEIQAPRGTFGAYIEGLDRTTQEYEYLLARETKMEVLDARVVDGVRKIVARVLF